MPFANRAEAGRLLAEALSKYAGRKDTLILAIPRGGLVIGYELSKALRLPLDVLVTKKIGASGNPEYAIGAVGPGSKFVLNPDASGYAPPEYFRDEIRRITRDIEEKYLLLKGREKPLNLKGKTVIITDDGVATGQTLLLGIQVVRAQEPRKIVVAVPVAPPESLEFLAAAADEVVCLETPLTFNAIGEFYHDFRQVSDEEAKGFLEKARKEVMG